MNSLGTARPSEAIRKNYLHDEVAHRLRALIQSGELRPRERINETTLSQRFGISRTPLREAIKILSSEGLLEILPNRGAQVASISQSEISDMLEVIGGLECVAGELACQHASAAEIERIAALNADMERAYEQSQAPEYFEINQKIHELILLASHNPTLIALYENLSTRIQRARFTAHKTPKQWEQAMQDHRQMVSLLQARDAEALGALLKAHVRSKRDVIAAQFGKLESLPESE